MVSWGPLGSDSITCGVRTENLFAKAKKKMGRRWDLIMSLSWAVTENGEAARLSMSVDSPGLGRDERG